ncbi:hypothetical protein [Clostridium tetani]|uniref:hypothetical protein n=1 Tax=Clostridium tetani TaxID=1513 RepID=UPI000D21C881|nr:hypothetical protein [Clostridium tetani]AVP55263.1 hypothetical protein C3B72_08935 [Clostridium tetani]RXI77886.1 hypothetical protein DP128_01820 [Clostridium tetani]RXM70722.1 hypothetical protein DP139_05580 [Clostridium tetani]WFN61256.1 hypothetical protein PAA20_09985 [Clostridium tetani]
MKALFGRKVLNLKELKYLTKEAEKDGMKGELYEVTKEVKLSDEEFKKFAKDFCRDQPWITKEDGGCNSKGELRCIRVKNTKTKKSILVDSESYDYPRYTAIEK